MQNSGVSPPLRPGRGIARFTAGVLLVLLSVDLLSVQALGKRIDIEISRIHAAGEPLTNSEAEPTVPDPENAASIYQQAYDLLPKSAVDAAGNYIAPSPTANISPEKMRQELSLASPALALARRAAAMPDCRFPVNRDGDELKFSPYGKIRILSRLFVARAIVDAEDGRSADAFADLVTISRMTRHVAQNPFLSNQLIVNECLGMVESSLRRVLAFQSPAPADTGRLHRGLAEVEVDASFTRMMEAERCRGLGMFDLARRNPSRFLAEFGFSDEDHSHMSLQALEINGDRLFGGPFLKMDEVSYLRRMASDIDRSKRRERMIPDFRLESGSNPSLLSLVTQTMLPGYEIAAERFMLSSYSVAAIVRDRAAAYLTLTQWALALKLDQERSGVYPTALNASVTAREWGLSTQDPFSSGDLIYRRLNEGYLLYSVGPDGKDDGGANELEDSIHSLPGTPHPDDIRFKVAS